MNVAISTTRPFHAPLLANALVANGASVKMYSSAPRRFFRNMDRSVRMRLVPSMFQVGMHVFHWSLTQNVLNLDSALYDRTAAAILDPGDLFIGWASAALASGRRAQKRGARFVLDRACPHVAFQQDLVGAEAEKAGAQWVPQPAWFRDRQLAEYAEADAILVPSEYTRRTFPAGLIEKTVKAPLLGRTSFPESVSYSRNPVFTVGAVGGQPLRKGYLYLLEAWKKLALPQARLIIRGDFAGYPRLQELAAEQPSVEVVGYVPDIAEFYRKCDLFVLPSIDDGFGMALFEAMGHGLPCIATTHCGSSELLTCNRDSVIVEPFSSDQLASAILRFYESEEFRQQIARNGRASIQALMPNGRSPLYNDAIGALLASMAARNSAQGPQPLPTRPLPSR